MSDNNDAKLIVLDPNDTWGLNIVNSQYAKEASQINQSLQTLMDQLAQSVAFGVKALYGVAAAIFYSSVCDAAINLAGSGSAMLAERGASNVENECNNGANGLKALEKKSNDIAKQLEDKDLTIKNKNKLLDDKNKIKSDQEKLQSKITTANTKVQAKMGAYNMMAQGTGAIFRGTQDSLKQKGEADSASYMAVQRQSESTYDTQKSVLKGFIDIDYFAGLITISSIQLR